MFQYVFQYVKRLDCFILLYINSSVCQLKNQIKPSYFWEKDKHLWNVTVCRERKILFHLPFCNRTASTLRPPRIWWSPLITSDIDAQSVNKAYKHYLAFSHIPITEVIRKHHVCWVRWARWSSLATFVRNRGRNQSTDTRKSIIYSQTLLNQMLLITKYHPNITATKLTAPTSFTAFTWWVRFMLVCSFICIYINNYCGQLSWLQS